jgi:uroporphyrinogen-III synthase
VSRAGRKALSGKSRSRSRESTKPLQGVRVLVGRARHQAGSLSTELRKLGAGVVEIPFIEIRKPKSFQPLNTALKNLQSYDWLILTSVNGVEAMWERLRRLRITNRSLRRLKIAAIGPATRKAIETREAKVSVVPKKYVAESVVKSLRKQVKGKRVLLVRAKIARDVIPRELRRAGAQIDVIEAYETVAPKTSRSRLRAALQNAKNRPDVIAFTSSSTVRNFVTLLGAAGGGSGRRRRPGNLEGVTLASIGPVTSATLRELHLGVDVEARQYTIPGLIRAIVASTRPM